ncbi:MAG: aminomethyl-transferring glycine dehydrogenase subunit GcvPA [Acidaminococcales bacterium]|nr:aminomethyl-transferring glycine dehydrogenase subunit GcvPA [Acidaminococcales bacterium]
MTWSYLPHTDTDRREMLAAIGAGNVDDLFRDVPEQLRLNRRLNLPERLDEAALARHMRQLAGKNAAFHEYSYFLGAGVYDHYVPAVVDAVISRSEFYTAYTQYQPEVAQGYLQALWEYQSMIASLAGMAAANASLYDGGTALAEAAMMACSVGKRGELVVSKALHPHYRALLSTYAIDLSIAVKETGYLDGASSAEELTGAVTGATAAVIVQTPNFFGVPEDLKTIAELAHKQGALLIVAADPVALALLEPPGALGADIVVGEGQPLGICASFGGPGLGFFATTEKLMRKMPGRIVGQTLDSKKRRGFVLTLQAREQHIRREKATSNICSNQALCALSAAVYLSAVGRAGLRDVAELSLQKAHYALERITGANGGERVFNAPFFKEFAVRLRKDVSYVNRQLLKDKIIGGLDLGRYYPELEKCMLICVTENRAKAEIDLLAERLGGLG